MTLLALLVLLAAVCYMVVAVNFGSQQLMLYSMKIRTPKLVVMLITAFAIGGASIVFQSIINNTIVTPCLLGMNSLYTLIHTAVVFFAGSGSLLARSANLSFAADVILMGIVATIIYSYLFQKTNHNVLYVLLIGTVLSSFFSSIQTTLTRVMDPNEYDSLLSTLVADFENINSEIIVFALVLLAGCAPAPEPTPEPTPTPAAAVDFHAFLDAVNEKRRAVIEEGEPLDISPWTPDFAGQNHTFTDGEMEALMTRRNMVDYLPPEKAREDLDVFFTLLRTTYGAYEYFGGDEVFEKLKAESIEILEDTTTPYGSTLIRLATALYLPLEGTVLDGHFTIGGSHLFSKLRTYYVPDIYISDPTGLSEDYVKPTIGPDGAITYGFFAMSKDGSDLPDTLGGYELSWTPCETVGPGHFCLRRANTRASQRCNPAICPPTRRKRRNSWRGLPPAAGSTPTRPC